MQKKTILVLLVIILGFAGILWYRDVANHRDSEAALEFLPSLKKQMVQVERIDITAGGEKPAHFQLVRENQFWKIPEKENYAANTQKIRQLLLQLSDAHVIEPKTADKKWYSKLGVQDPDPAGGLQVSLFLHEKTNPAFSFLLGNFSGIQNGTYLRKKGDSETWLVKGKIAVENEADLWLDKEIINLAPEEIEAIVVQLPGKTYSLTKKSREDRHFTLLGKAGAEVAAEKIDEMGNALRYVHFAAVKRGTPDQLQKLSPTRIEYRLFDGLRLVLTLAEENGQHYLTLQAFDSIRPNGGVSAFSDKTKKNKDANQTEPEIQNGGYTAEMLNAKWSGWIYTIPPYKAEALAKKWGALQAAKK